MTAQKSRASSSSEETRDRLLEAAARLFAQRGFDGVSVKELADEAGVNVSLVSYHFGGKESLYRTCLEQFGKERLAVATRVLQPPQSVEELRLRLTLFTEEVFACHIEDSDRSRIVLRECDMDVPIAQDIFRDTILKVFETLVGFLQAAQKAQLIQSELDPMIMAAQYFGGIMHFVRNDCLGEKFFGRTIRDEAYRRKVVDQFIHTGLHGLLFQPVPAVERSSS